MFGISEHETWCTWCKHNYAYCSEAFAVFHEGVFKSHPISVFPFSCLVSTFLVILPRQIAVTPPNLGYLASGLIRVMWLHLHQGRTVWVQIPPGANFFRCRYKKIHLFRPNIDHRRFCYGLIRVMWLHLRPPEQCGFKSHQVPTFSGVGIRKYTFFRPNILCFLLWD